MLQVVAFKSKVKLYKTTVHNGSMTVFFQMTTLLNSLPDAQYSFPDEVSTHIFTLIESIENNFYGLNDWFSDAWMFSTFE